MTATFIGLAGVVIGAFVGAITTYLTTRSNMRLQLEYAYDQTLRDKRLERYQELFHLSKCFPRYWLSGEEPTRKDLRQFHENFHDWYFGEAAGGMFLTIAAKELYLNMQNAIFNAVSKEDGTPKEDAPLLPAESKALIDMASALRHQLAEYIGAANAPRLNWTRPKPTLAPAPERQIEDRE